MEWVEVTAKSVEDAKELALDRLGISIDDAEFSVIEEPRPGLFGRIRGEARVRARVRPAMVRQKHDRRRRGGGTEAVSAAPATEPAPAPSQAPEGDEADRDQSASAAPEGQRSRSRRRRGGSAARAESTESGQEMQGGAMEEQDGATQVPVEDVRAAAETFCRGLVSAFGLEASTSSAISGNEIEVRVDSSSEGLGLLIGPSGRTLLAIQDLARVAAQRRLGDHDTRLRIDVAGYREKRRAALERFAREVAEVVKETGVPRSLEPMPSSDRKVIHDTLATISGVVTRSEGEDPFRRIIVSPA